MRLLLHVVQGIFALSAISWFVAFTAGRTDRKKALFLSIAFGTGALSSFYLQAWWPLAVGFAAVVIGGTIIESLGAGFGEVARLHARYEVGASAEQRAEVAARILDLALQKDSRKARHTALHRALDVLLCEGRFENIPTESPLHRRYWELGHRVATEILRHQEYLNIQAYWFAEDYDKAKELLARR